jgi:hypothetical protein
VAPRRGEAGTHAPDANGNGVDDRLEQQVSALLGSNRGEQLLQVALLLPEDPTPALFDVLERYGARVEAQAYQPAALLVWVPASQVGPLSADLGDRALFIRWGATEPRPPARDRR